MTLFASDIAAYEEGRMTDERKVKFFKALIREGITLQGQYAEDAQNLIDKGLLDEST